MTAKVPQAGACRFCQSRYQYSAERYGKFWICHFDGVQLPPLPNTRGMLYITELLRRPWGAISSMEISAIAWASPNEIRRYTGLNEY